MKCDAAQDLLSEYVDGALEAPAVAELERHLAECASCRRELETLRRTVNLVRSLPQVPAPRDFSVRSPQAQIARPPVRTLRARRWAIALNAAALTACAVLIVSIALEVLSPARRATVRARTSTYDRAVHAYNAEANRLSQSMQRKDMEPAQEQSALVPATPAETLYAGRAGVAAGPTKELAGAVAPSAPQAVPEQGAPLVEQPPPEWGATFKEEQVAVGALSEVATVVFYVDDLSAAASGLEAVARELQVDLRGPEGRPLESAAAELKFVVSASPTASARFIERLKRMKGFQEPRDAGEAAKEATGTAARGGGQLTFAIILRRPRAPGKAQ